MEQLTAEGLVMGTGPYYRSGDKILNNQGCESSTEVDHSCRLGLVEAFRRKANMGTRNVNLIVKAVGFTQAMALDAARFRQIVGEAADASFPSRFGRVYVVDYGRGFIWTQGWDLDA